MTLEKKSPYILLVDDNNEVREALIWALEYAGYVTVGVKNGQEALNFLEKNPLPAVIFLDLMMPVLDGMEFREKKKLSLRIKNITTIITSAKTNLEKMEKMPHEIFLSKPFDLNDLLRILTNYIDQNQIEWTDCIAIQE
ncbi:two-component response regulator [Legionella wadsworthii]|uniref:Two-component response regulator n=1 Tax=Legionella wadsworthii TaxID=28088 RepID=A0A378LP62_9GAMM|nr:response regulator [Legionella wadsworthii]STY28544.1 two-component response regulator [Legionella wadsworthii]